MKTKDQIQTEALAAIGNRRKAGVESSMGTGKTLIGIKHMYTYYHECSSFLVVAPKTTIFDTWKTEMTDYGYGFLRNHTSYSTYLSLPEQELDYDVVYLDECHSLTFSHSVWLKAYEERGGTIIGLTGTYPDKPFSEKGKMCHYFCPRVYRYQTDDAIDDKILNDYRIFVHKLYLNAMPTIEVTRKDNGKFLTSEIKQYAYWTQRLDDAGTPKEEQLCRIQRMKKLQNFESKEVYAKKIFESQKDKAIIFANTKAQADRLCTHSYYSGNKNSKENLIKFKAGEIFRLSAVEQLNEGVNIPNLKVGVIMHSFANNRRASQKIGRMLRLNPDDVATIHILCYYNSVDQEWVTSALKHLDQSKITWIDAV